MDIYIHLFLLNIYKSGLTGSFCAAGIDGLGCDALTMLRKASVALTTQLVPGARAIINFGA